MSAQPENEKQLPGLPNAEPGSVGSSFSDFLEEHGLLADADRHAAERIASFSGPGGGER